LHAEFFATDIARHKQALTPLILHQPFCFARIFVFVELDDGHIRSLLGKQHRDGTADSTITTGDQRDFVL